ncbi:helix-turn-helix transcriptional regulator [Marinilactibacillus sp. XAAS-LB27]|uniref:helix-turn-helix domain-containing protein n=1 Tax=Marinilactibacillus sp. XAAS-LB27 TaxID=3114538 RepID=UPI002E17E26F|nr:helix-turn-helix transcriptional regulator [Marinilactibacillus sp. XAAS-LB27]
MEFGPKIKALRIAAGMTAKELAQKIDISPSFISAIEHNSTKLSLKTLSHICDALDVSLSEFFNDDASPIEKRLITIIQSLPEEKQYDLLKFLDGLNW